MATELITVECPHCFEEHEMKIDTYLKPNTLTTCGECNGEFVVWYDPSDRIWITSAGYEFSYEKGEKPSNDAERYCF